MTSLKPKTALPKFAVQIKKLVRWDRRTGNALAFADVLVLDSAGETLYRNVKLCQNDSGPAFISEEQENYIGCKLYRFRSEHRQPILDALLAAYERRPFAARTEKPVAAQLALFAGVGA